ncbi:MAG: hypothetical protein KIT17_00555 [Rubrivivax sp.]|nr:hypothetical protein [Rubrivivax sp.]
MSRESSKALVVASALLTCPPDASAFNSASTGTDGDFSPVTSVEVALPPGGIFNFRSINIPAGVTVTFRRNAANTPVVWLVAGDAFIGGVVRLDGSTSPATGRAGDGSLLDDGDPGTGGPGAGDGGRGGEASSGRLGGFGLGPGGGGGGVLGQYFPFDTLGPSCGGGGGHATVGAGGNAGPPRVGSASGDSYGNDHGLPLLGGSGGGGGASGERFKGSGGGGGGGAILIAASGTVTIAGQVSARGGGAGATDDEGDVAAGGGGSGGFVRIVATRLIGAGVIDARGSVGGSARLATPQGIVVCTGGQGSHGRVRLEAETLGFTGSTPGLTASIAIPGTLFIDGRPAIRLVSIGDITVPTAPTGRGDVTLPPGGSDTVSVVIETVGVPVGTVLRLRLVPAVGPLRVAESLPSTGTVSSARATATIDVPTGQSTLTASATYSVPVALGAALSRYAGGHHVKGVSLTTTLGGAGHVNVDLITAGGTLVPANIAALRLLSTTGARSPHSAH